MLVLVCVALWALIPVVAKLGQTTLDNHQFLFWSSLVSCLVLTTTAFVRGRIADLRSYSAKDWLQLIALGLLGTYVYYLLLYLGYSRAVGMEVLVFQYTWPLLVVLLSLVILRERMTLRKIVALVFGCIGVVAVLTKGQLRTIRVDNPGVIALVVLGALSFALFSVLSKKVRKDPLMVTAVYFLVATVASLISMLHVLCLDYPLG